MLVCKSAGFSSIGRVVQTQCNHVERGGVNSVQVCNTGAKALHTSHSGDLLRFRQCVTTGQREVQFLGRFA